MNRHTELTSLLRGLKLQAMADGASDVALKAARANLSHEAFLYELARLEQEQRTQRRVERLRRESGLPREKTFATLALARFSPLVRQQVERLRRGEFVKEAVNVVAVGPPGVGKSHVLASVAHALIEQGMAVLWSSTAQLMQRLLAAKRDLRLPQELARLDRYACLVLDDIGYVQHDQDEMEVLFTLLEPRYPYCEVPHSLHLTPAHEQCRKAGGERVFLPDIVAARLRRAQSPLRPVALPPPAGRRRQQRRAGPGSPGAMRRCSVSGVVHSADDRQTNNSIHAVCVLYAPS